MVRGSHPPRNVDTEEKENRGVKETNYSHISGCLSKSASQVFKLGPPLHQPKRSQLYQLTASPQ